MDQNRPLIMEEKEKNFYTKAELEEFRVLITEKLHTAEREYKELAESLRDSNVSTADGYNMTDFGSDTLEKEQTEMFMARQMKFIGSLQRALDRIENGSYGRCKETGKLISKERLRAVPHTELSIEAKRIQPK
jgi:DnaK suppressor protein